MTNINAEEGTGVDAGTDVSVDEINNEDEFDIDLDSIDFDDDDDYDTSAPSSKPTENSDDVDIDLSDTIEPLTKAKTTVGRLLQNQNIKAPEFDSQVEAILYDVKSRLERQEAQQQEQAYEALKNEYRRTIRKAAESSGLTVDDDDVEDMFVIASHKANRNPQVKDIDIIKDVVLKEKRKRGVAEDKVKSDNKKALSKLASASTHGASPTNASMNTRNNELNDLIKETYKGMMTEGKRAYFESEARRKFGNKIPLNTALKKLAQLNAKYLYSKIKD